MNEPIQQIHRREDSNSTLYRNMGIQVGVGLASQAVMEGALHGVHKYTTNDKIKQATHNALFVDGNVKSTGIVNPVTGTNYYDKLPEGRIKNVIGKIPAFGQSTLRGRAFGYGGAVVGGLIGGAIQTKAEQR